MTGCNRISELDIDGVRLIEIGTFPDERGCFTELYRESQIQEAIAGFRCVQVNQSLSNPGVLRGLHWQSHAPMGKLVRVLDGRMYDLLLDVRPNSPTFGKSLIVPMEADQTWIWVPQNVAHGVVCPVDTRIEYLCTAEYNPAGEHCICPLSVFELKNFGAESCIISPKDSNAPTFEEWKSRL
jgi:dTDP-4-dehydrorhamnose 3,5-epimerase